MKMKMLLLPAMLALTFVGHAHASVKDTFINPIDTLAVGIGTSQSLSAAFDCGGLRPTQLILPSSWTAADITFQVSADGGTTYVPLYDGKGHEYRIIAEAGRAILLDPAVFDATQSLKIQSGTSATPVAQAAARTLTIVLK